jgi:NADH-quinone oxidoreductase subunit J
LFFFLAAMAVTTAVLMVVHRNPVVSAISLIGNFFCLAGLYLLLRAQLLAVLQIAVYAGAIMVLVVFVIMLLNVGEEDRPAFRPVFRTMLGTGLAMGFALEMLYLFVLTPFTEPLRRNVQAGAGVGTVEAMGAALFSRYLFPLELTGMLLLAAVIGAVILAKKRPT